MNKINEIVTEFIKQDILCTAAENPNYYHITDTLAQMLETFAGVEIVNSDLPPIWKRKSTCELIDDPELNALAAEIVRHEQEDFDDEKEESNND